MSLMENYALGVLGIAVSVLFILIGYRQTVSANIIGHKVNKING